MEEFVYYNNLFDVYGSLLTEKEQITFKDYYQEDLSLAEIANENNVSRAAVQKTIKNVLDKLKNQKPVEKQKFKADNLLSNGALKPAILIYQSILQAEIDETVDKILDKFNVTREELEKVIQNGGMYTLETHPVYPLLISKI